MSVTMQKKTSQERTVQIGTRLPFSIHKRLKWISYREDKSIQEIVEVLISDYCDAKDKEARSPES